MQEFRQTKVSERLSHPIYTLCKIVKNMNNKLYETVNLPTIHKLKFSAVLQTSSEIKT